MPWLDETEIGGDLQVCPDCDRGYEVLEQFLGASDTDALIDAVFNDTFYVAIRCPQCLETRYLCIRSLTAAQFHIEKENK